ncbi:MAG: LacI family DNA-binding transcriptional regulator [Fervidobacterium sp.]|uniref:LacI family DNA-binding transcriptional regulator n=1 Tax=Fervidobacterium sp. TaxID=1871331 RepID=UPI00404A7FB4
MVKKKDFVTIKDVAKVSGYSINTVSRALGNRGYVKRETKEKILKVASELGYMRNCAASALRTKRSHIVGVVVVDNTNPFYAEVIKGIELEAKKYGYTIILINTDRSYENEEKAIEILLQRRVEGLIITAVQTKNDDLRRLVEEKIPNVIIGSKFEDLATNYVCSDDEKGGYLAARHLIETNHRNLLLVNAEKFKYAAKMRELGVRRAIEEAREKIELEVIYSKDGFDNGYDTFAKFIGKSRKKFSFDGIICYNDVYAFAVMKALKERGIKIPDEVSIVGFDDIYFSSIVEPSLTTVRTDKLKLGAEAFRILINNIESGSVTELTLPVELVVRNSTIHR